MADESAILAVVLDLLADAGYERMTTDEVAAAAKVSKTTLYRRWPTKLDLAVAAVDLVSPPVVDPELGDPWSAIVALLDALAAGLHGRGLALFAGMIGAGPSAPELTEAWRRSVVAPRRAALLHLLERARATAVLRPEAEPVVLADALVGALFFRALVLGQPAAPGVDVAALVAHVLTPWRGPG